MSSPSKSGYITGSIWERVLIIIFGFALLMIGADHFKEPYGGIVNYLRNKGAQFAGNDRNESPYGFSGERGRLRSDWQGPTIDVIDRYGSSSSRDDDEFMRAREKRAKIIPMPQDVQRAARSGNLSRLPKADDVGESNRRELNRLINEY